MIDPLAFGHFFKCGIDNSKNDHQRRLVLGSEAANPLTLPRAGILLGILNVVCSASLWIPSSANISNDQLGVPLFAERVDAGLASGRVLIWHSANGACGRQTGRTAKARSSRIPSSVFRCLCVHRGRAGWSCLSVVLSWNQPYHSSRRTQDVRSAESVSSQAVCLALSRLLPYTCRMTFLAILSGIITFTVLAVLMMRQ